MASQQIHEQDFSSPTIGGNEEIEEIGADQFSNKKGSSHRGKAFMPQEDRVIVSGWLNISTDATTGTH